MWKESVVVCFLVVQMQSGTTYYDEEESHRVRHYPGMTAKSMKPLNGVVTKLTGHLVHK
jgi:hypothetical protein